MKPYTSQRDTHEEDRTFHESFLFPSEDFTLFIHRNLKHLHISLSRNPEEEQGRLKANNSQPQKPDCYNFTTFSPSTKPSGQGSGIAPLPGRSAQFHHWLSNDHKRKYNSLNRTVAVYLIPSTWEKQVDRTLFSSLVWSTW